MSGGHWTKFAGLAAPEDTIQDLNSEFIYRNPDLVDQFLRIGAIAHRHDGHAGLPNPTHPITFGTTSTPGSLSSDTEYFITYTVVDPWGGETMAAPGASATTGGSVPTPTLVPSAGVSHASGIMPAGNYAYAFTLTDGSGGETTLGPTEWIYIDPGFASGEVNFVGLSAMLTGGAVAWRMWRSYEGSDWHLVTQGTSNTFTDAGFDPPDNPARPPESNTTGTGATALTATIPGSAVDPAIASGAQIKVYFSSGSDFWSPSLLTTLPIACAGSTLTITSSSTSNGEPPHANLSIGGAARIYGPTEVIGWQTLVASAATGSATAKGELIFEGTGGTIVTVQDLGGGSAVVSIAGGTSGGGGSSTFVASAGNASGVVGGFLGFAASGGASVELVNTGGSAVILISASGLTGPQGQQGASGAQGIQGSQGLIGPPGPAGSGSAATLEVAYVQTASANVVVGTSLTDILTLAQIPAGTKGPVWLDFQSPSIQIANTTSYARFEIVDDLGNIVISKITPVNNVTAGWFAGSFNMRAKVENPGGRTYKVRAITMQGGGTVTLQPWADSNGGTQPIFFAAVGTYVPFSGGGTNHSVGGSGGVGIISPDTYIEFAGSGGTAVALQSLGGGSARVLISAPSAASGGGGGGSALAPAFPRQLAVFGHSYGQSVFGGNSGIELANRQSTRLAQAIGAIESNHAVGGSVLGIENNSGLAGAAATGGYPTILGSFIPASGAAPYLSPLGAVLMCTGINDYCMFGSAGFPTYFPAALQASIDRLRCGRTYEDSDASVNYPTGGWSQQAFDGHVNSGSSLHGTNASAATVQVTLPTDYNGEALSFGTVINGGAPSPWSTTAACSVAAVDHLSNPLGSLDLKALWVAFNNSTTHGHNGFATLRIPKGALPAGAQTITLTFTNPGNNSIWFDWWGIEADTPPIIVLEAPIRLTSTGYSAESFNRPFTLDDTGVATVLAALKQVAAVYTDGRVVVADGADAVINKNAAMLTTDQVHPNAAGAGIVAGFDFQALATYLASHPTEALQTQKDDIGPNLGGLTVARAYCAALVPGGFANGWNRIPIDTVSFDPGGNMQVTGGSHKYVCPTDGYYSVKAQVLLGNQAADINYLAVYVNGTRITDGQCMKTASGGTGTLNALVVDDILSHPDGSPLRQGDSIELYFNTTNTAANYMVGGDASNNYLSVVRVA